MKVVDIIIPARYKNLNFIPSVFKISTKDWYPVLLNQDRIELMGYKLRFFTIFNLPRHNISDTVIFDYRSSQNLVNTQGVSSDVRVNALIKFLQHLKRRTKSLIFFDTKDSTNIQFKILPFVDFYYKKQVTKDKSLNEKKLVGNRLYTDFYQKKYKIIEENFSHSNSINSQNNDSNLYSKYKDNIGISWNILLALDTFPSNASRIEYLFKKKIKLKYGEIESDKKILINGNFSKDYRSDLISFQRRKMFEFLLNHPLTEYFSLGIVPKKEYLRNMMTSKYVVSPFGWGEICYRDYEAFIAGAVLIKPDMSHVETWPNLYIPDETYFPISWEIEEWEEEFNEILRNDSKRRKIAEVGQNQFDNLWNENNMQYFSERFIQLIDIF